MAHGIYNWDFYCRGFSGITSLYSDFFTNDVWKKYYDQYFSDGANQYHYLILGDATGEFGGFGSQKDLDSATRYKSSWYNDFGQFARKVSPWFTRGGSWYGAISSGVFAFSNFTGEVFKAYSYRVVLSI